MVLGRLAFAENHFRDAGSPPTIHVQQRELAQRGPAAPAARSGRDAGPGPVGILGAPLGIRLLYRYAGCAQAYRDPQPARLTGGCMSRFSEPDRDGCSSISARRYRTARTKASTATCSSGSDRRTSSAAPSCTRPRSPKYRTAVHGSRAASGSARPVDLDSTSRDRGALGSRDARQGDVGYPHRNPSARQHLHWSFPTESPAGDVGHRAGCYASPAVSHPCRRVGSGEHAAANAARASPASRSYTSDLQ